MAEDALGAWLADRQRAALADAGGQHDDEDGRVEGVTGETAAGSEEAHRLEALEDDPWSQVQSADARIPLWAEDERPPRRRRRVLALAAIPWVLVLVLLVPVARRGLDAADAPAAPPTARAEDPTGGGDAAVVASGADGDDPSARAGAPVAGAGQQPTPEAASAAAELAVRSAWSTASVPMPGARYVEDARAIAVRPADGVLVVRVAALLLTGTVEGWGAPTTQLLDVAVAGSPASVLAGPWPVSPAAPQTGADVPERVEAVAAVLAAAGMDVAVQRVELLDGLPLLRATVEARAADGGPAQPFDVLLADGDPPSLLSAAAIPPPTGAAPTGPTAATDPGTTTTDPADTP